MGRDDIVRAQQSSIRFIPPQQDEERADDPVKSSSPDSIYAPAPRRKLPSFQFDLASSPELGESAITPPQPYRGHFDTETRQLPRHPHARSSSQAVPWLQPGQPLRSKPIEPVPSAIQELSPVHANESRFSRNSSSLSEKQSSPSPAVDKSYFSPTTAVDDSTEGDSSQSETQYAVHLASYHGPTAIDNSPPPLALRHERPLSSPRTPPTPSAWRSFFTAPLPQPKSRFSASTASPATNANNSPPTPNPPSSSMSDSDSDSDSFDGTSSPDVGALPQAIPPRRVNSSSSLPYSHAFPTTYLEAIEEDEVYPSSPPPIPARSLDRPLTRDMESPRSARSALSMADRSGPVMSAINALAAAAGNLDPGSQRSSLRLQTPPPVAAPPAINRLSLPPQIPPLPPFDHNTSPLQRLFSFYPSPRLPTDTPHLAQEPFVAVAQLRSPGSSLVSFGSIRGPQGERFSELREKRQSRGVYWSDGTQKKPHIWCGIRGMSWKMWAVVLVLLILVFGIIAVGVGVGLSRGNGAKSAANAQDGGTGDVNNDTPGANGSNIDNGPLFPAGTFRIMTNLRNVTTSCTNVSATWNCAPGAAQTFWEAGINSSAITVVWKIRQENLTEGFEGNGFKITSVDDPFALRFSNVPLTLMEIGTENEHWGFEAQVRKKVRPFVDVSGRNAAVECIYDSVNLEARLFTKRQPDDGLSGGTDTWPGAVETAESSEIEGQCAEISNGERGQEIDVGVGPAECACAYSNFDPAEE